MIDVPIRTEAYIHEASLFGRGLPVPINSCLYRIHKHFFFVSEAGFFKDMFALPQPANEEEGLGSKEGTTDDTAISIPEVTCKESEALPNFFYYWFVPPHHAHVQL